MMKKITEDLKITGIEISMLKQVATVTFKYVDEYEASALYSYRSAGNTWLESNDVPDQIHMAITLEVEENESEIIDWVNDQFNRTED